MKDQYFGDINDYGKYGLLRAIIGASDVRLLVAWMLTPDDPSSHGGFVSYLQDPETWRRCDPGLFEEIKKLLAGKKRRGVKLIENSGILPRTEYFSVPVPDSASDRGSWFNSLVERARESDLVFLDPDNGLEVKSKPYGRKNSSKYLYWREVEALWSLGKSLLIFQYFIREKRFSFVHRMLGTLRSSTPGSYVEAFSARRVVFLMALQPKHKRFREAIVNSVRESWGEHIQCWESGEND